MVIFAYEVISTKCSLETGLVERAANLPLSGLQIRPTIVPNLVKKITCESARARVEALSQIASVSMFFAADFAKVHVNKYMFFSDS